MTVNKNNIYVLDMQDVMMKYTTQVTCYQNINAVNEKEKYFKEYFDGDNEILYSQKIDSGTKSIVFLMHIL
jgi:hypothetical protein